MASKHHNAPRPRPARAGSRAHRPMLRDGEGGYRAASQEQILASARLELDELVRRGPLMDQPRTVGDYIALRLAKRQHEVFVALFLDGRHRLIDCVEMFRGTIDAAAVYPREVV